jgi:hypothetical protein
MANAETTVEYHVWYDAPDGVRRSMNALDAEGIQQIISDVHEDEKRRQILAASVGLSVPANEFNFEIFEVTTKIEQVDL